MNNHSQYSKNSLNSTLSKTLIGTALTAASCYGNAAIISSTDLNVSLNASGTLVGNFTTLANIGGMTNVQLVNYPNDGLKLEADGILNDSSITEGLLIGPVDENGIASDFSSDQTKLIDDLGSPNDFTDDIIEDEGFFGVNFDNGAGIQYGWLEVDAIATGTNTDLILKGWGYNNTPGESILAGQTTPVSAPASLLLLALGSVGLGAMRRRKTQLKD